MMKWYDIRFWKWATITLVVGLALVSVLGCSTPRAVTTQTFITDKQSEKKVRFPLHYPIVLCLRAMATYPKARNRKGYQR